MAEFKFFRLSESLLEIRSGSSQPIEFYITLLLHLNSHLDGSVEVSNTEDSLIIEFKEVSYSLLGEIERLVTSYSYQAQLSSQADSIYLPCRYHTDTADILALCSQLAINQSQIKAIHANCRFKLSMYGFIPGFFYLTGLDNRLVLPRKDNPSTNVKAGSIAIAGGYCAVYPHDTPGGWYVIGEVVEPISASISDTHLENGFLKIGTQIMFKEIVSSND
jgi:KipI family sensor histidine kinase inhibitor